MLNGYVGNVGELGYLNLLQDILDNGQDVMDRTGVGTRSVFGRQLRFDTTKGFPLLTTKRIHRKSVIHELLFFLSGQTNAKILEDNGVQIWREWGDNNRNLGPIYSHQWRNFGGAHSNRPQPAPRLDHNFDPTVHGVASMGNYIKGTSPVLDKLLVTWQAMIARCYNPNNDNYDYYGGRGVFVCNEWLLFTNFAKDAQKLPGWKAKKESWRAYDLDKDIHGDSFQYSFTNCAWVLKSNNMQARARISYIVEHEDGRTAQFINSVSFYTEHGINQGNFSAMLRGERAKAGGWSLMSAHDLDEGIDQISNVMYGLLSDPHGRRHVVSAWNPIDIQHMALPPCHILFQFYVRKVGRSTYLDCHLTQRSGDALLGIPFNIASYSLLIHMMAQQLDMLPGEFILSIGDAHIYKNHFDAVAEQLSRLDQIQEPPKLTILRKPDSIFDYKYEDFKFTNYKPLPSIPAPIAV